MIYYCWKHVAMCDAPVVEGGDYYAFLYNCSACWTEPA